MGTPPPERKQGGEGGLPLGERPARCLVLIGW